ncbi:NnrU family protein [Caenimonas koreensis]|uniref:Protein NrnU n=1 Tax=Caenimonas koreensis DSM 17982 TaxID=1121255 RepID=A0A844B8L6_9BURK|nr:NnrU family protein [Caenimonas koreensis]MRD46871.1 protein NrnU [Caenimonas koreensis DSM 17982]
MAVLILGLAIFLGVHSVRIFADGWRTAMIAKMGANAWKGLYTALSIIGFVVLVIGYKMARVETTALWLSPGWMKHVTALMMLFAFIFFVAAYVPRNWFKYKFHHPQVLSVKIWSLAHLLSVGLVVDVVVFGAFLAWAVLSFRAGRQRDRANNTVYAAPSAAGTAITVVVGAVACGVFALWLHGPLIGVRPFG